MELYFDGIELKVDMSDVTQYLDESRIEDLGYNLVSESYNALHYAKSNSEGDFVGHLTIRGYEDYDYEVPMGDEKTIQTFIEEFEDEYNYYYDILKEETTQLYNFFKENE